MFYDIHKLNYEKLKKITNEVKPYRSSNAYPLGYRDYSDRHFRPLPHDEGFALYYWDRKIIDNVVRLGNPSRAGHYPFAIVRQDNSIEFTRETSQMSENLILQNMLNAHVYHSKAHSGTIIRRNFYDDPNRATMHPMFRGLRIDMDTLKAVTPYELYSKRLIRSEAKEYLKKFEDTKNVGLAMLMAMRADGLQEMITDIRKQGVTKSFYEMVDKNYHADALMMFYLSVDYIWWNIEEGNKDRLLRRINNAIATKYSDYVLRNSDVGFYLKKLESESLFPSSKWGYKIVCNGAEPIRM